ncbi:PKD domain-containing protein [Promethearchaeum syntrophicum]|uniref:PKD domain-containing protein n=1 Tax=Promethearchaeum syntrophicum TaxID=2594042 RepID=A0A5B9DCX7_9ARCH|nr:PKD domain-containing protein [Candidatus Prometheoarchaeum syntrophicum]
MRISRNNKKELKCLKNKKIQKYKRYVLLGIVFISFILPSSVGLFADNQNLQDSNSNEFLEMMQKSQSAGLSQQWSPGTTVSGCINPWEFWEFLWRLFYHFRPNMDFTANITEISPGDTVQFEYTGGNNWWPKTFHWDFGDGGLAEERNPTHTYESSGVYNVSLTIIYFWIFDDTITKENYIEVSGTSNNVPEADFVVDYESPLTGDLLQFTYTGTEGDGLESFSWDFGDGIGFSDERNPTYSYSNAGTYDVSLLVTDFDGDEDSAVKEDYITVIEDLEPLANFEADIFEFLEGGMVQFTSTSTLGNGINSYSWDFGDGGTSSETNPSYQYFTPGIFTVSLTVIDEDGDADTAIKGEYITVIEDLEPEADFTASSIQVIQNGYLNFTYTGSEGNGLVSYSWDFGDGTPLSTEFNPTHQFLETGIFTVSLTVVDSDGDASTATKIDYITVDDDLMPNAEFSSDFQSVITDDIIQFTFTGEEGNSPATFWWDFGDGSTSEERDPIYQYSDPGFYTISLTVSDTDGDENTETKFDFIEVQEDLFPFTHFFADPTEAYTGELIQFSFLGEEGNGPSEFFYEFGDGSTSTEENPTHSYSEAGLYSIILTVTDIDGDIDVLELINYISIEENILPIADFTADFAEVVGGDLIQFSFIGRYGNDPNEFYWDFGDGSTSIEENPTHSYSEAGIYNVSLTIVDANGDIDTIIKVDYIIVENEFPMVIVMGGSVGTIGLISTVVIISKKRK